MDGHAFTRACPGGQLAPDRRLCRMGVVGAWGDRRYPADRLDPVGSAMIVNDAEHGLDRRSSSAIAKYADALRRISLAWRSAFSLTPRMISGLQSFVVTFAVR
jgi:hypothetical protein